MKLNRLFLLTAALVSSSAHSPALAADEKFTADHAAILRNGDVKALKAALDGGLPVNGRDAQGNSPLMLSLVYADIACARLLLERGAEVNIANAAGATPLMRAASDAAKLELLLERGAEVGRQSALGNTALMLAARPANSHRAVELLLAHGADVNATNIGGATALMAAAAGGDRESVRLLLKAGANANAQPGVDHVSFIFGGGRSALMWAAFCGHTEIMKQLLAAGADVNSEGFLGTPLSQAVWANQTRAARLLIEHGANVSQAGHGDSFTPLHWAASTELRDTSLVNLLLKHGADANAGGGQSVEAFMDISQTPLMLARRRGETPIVAALTKAGAASETADLFPELPPLARSLNGRPDATVARDAVNLALPPLQSSSLESKQNFVSHASRQDCTSCHQQLIPLAAIGSAKKLRASVDTDAERKLIEIVRVGDLKNTEVDWQALFHPELAHTKGYTLFGYACEQLPPDELTDSEVHHLARIQAADGRWLNNLPRPPIQTSDVGATALAIHALQKYPLPGRKAEFATRVDRARKWLSQVKPANHEERVYQLLGLAWAGETPARLKSLTKALLAEQRGDGGWAQLPGLSSDAYATGQSVYALRVASGIGTDEKPVMDGARFLLRTQLSDGTWYVRRRAFPFQPTMKSGFPHGRDSWISATGTSWAILALSQMGETQVALKP